MNREVNRRLLPARVTKRDPIRRLRQGWNRQSARRWRSEHPLDRRCLRFAEDDFRERSTQGIEDDWPITYKDLAPYYSHVEKMIGVTGSRENLPVVPDGDYLPP